jgi:hypothetical protein
MTGTILVGIVGLAGIVATFFAPTWTATKLERRRETREFRRASRLVASELNAIATYSGILAESGIAPDFEAEEAEARTLLPTHDWLEHRAVLATALDDNLWGLLDAIYLGVEQTRFAVLEMEPGAPLRKKTIELLQASKGHAERARARLLRAQPLLD